MEEKSELQSVPSNYVTLLQLQERWIKKQQRKQKEKEEAEKRELEKLKEEKGKEKTDSNPRFRAGYRNANVINRRIVEVAPPESAEVEAVEEKTGGGELKKNKRRKKKRNKNKKEGDMEGESENHAPEGRSDMENVPARSGGERKGGRSEMRPRSENLKVEAERRRGEKEDVPAISGGERSKNSVVVVDQTVEIELKLRNLSVKEGIVNGGSVRRNVINRDDRRFERWENSGGQRRFDHRENWGKLVWVRKGEASDGNGGGIPSSLG